MRKILLILFFYCSCAGILLAQEEGPQDQNSQSSSKTEKSSKPLVVVKSHISSFQLENQFSLIRPVAVDTSTIDFHNYSPMYQQGISNTHLGYLGAPFISNDFFKRINYSDYYFQTSLNAFCKSQHDVTYYNSTTPFSILMYDQGSGRSNEDEQVFSAFLTQNIDSVTNFGFKYNVVKGIGQYQNQSATHNNLNFFISRNTLRYNGYASLLTGSNTVLENGGLSESFINIRRNPYNLMVNLPAGIGPVIKMYSLFTSHEYLLGEIPFLQGEADTDSVFIPRYGIQYSAEIANYIRNYTEETVASDFFNNTYFDDNSGRYDSSSYQRVTQILQLKVLESPKRKFTFGKRAFLENEIITAMHPVFDGQRKFNYSNLFAGGEIYNRSNNFLQWSAMVRFALLGRNIGDAMLKGTLNKPLHLFGDTLYLYAEGWYQDISPNIFQEHWQDNHFKWENNFTKQHEVVLKARTEWDKFNLKAGVNYAFMGNFLYNGKDAKPAQYNGVFSVLSAWVNKEFILGPLRWNNKLIWQESSSSSVIHLPSWNVYSSISFSGLLFKVMKYQFGAEVYYNSTFYADKYEPSTSRFYIQEDMLTGGYPQLNAFINAKLKRTSAFAQLTHFNSYFSGGNFFSAPYYPINQMAFRFGFLWSFYD